MNSNSISKNKKISVQLFFANQGKISFLSSFSELVENNLVLEGRFNFNVGDTIKKTENATQRVGHFIVKADTNELLFEKVDEVFKRIKILDKKGNNLVIPYKDHF
ncbi:MAG: hypothetical protein H0S78_09650 [Tissierellales bacterium]|nr:hypothetical protein [Tissierellales bacterium]